MRGAALTAALILPGLAHAAAGDVAAGHQKSELCAPCHGDSGLSTMPGTPNLAGNADLFLQWQLVFFRNGRRHSEVINPVASELSDEDIRNLGAYYASLAPNAETPSADPAANLSASGEAAVREHRCANCHTDDFGGKRAAARLARQREEYLAKALTDYRSGARPSTGVAAMTEAAATLSDDDILAIAHYLAYFPATP